MKTIVITDKHDKTICGEITFDNEREFLELWYIEKDDIKAIYVTRKQNPYLDQNNKPIIPFSFYKKK